MHLAKGDASQLPRVEIGVATAAAESRAQQVVRDEGSKLSADLNRDLAAHRGEIARQIQVIAAAQEKQADALTKIGQAVARIEGQLTPGVADWRVRGTSRR
jgi:hypothetical protein